MNCGEHILSGSALAQVKNEIITEQQRALRAHRVFKTAPDAIIGTDTLHAFATVGALPGAAECIDNLVLYLASRLQPGQLHFFRAMDLVAAVGVLTPSAAAWVLQEGCAAGWVEAGQDPAKADRTASVSLRLTAKGWERQRQIEREGAGSRHAFMAMDFKAPDIAALFTDHLAPGVQRTGFVLRTTDHPDKPAGPIDHRMRVELRTSRFVVCDLTHHNRGAYWEAGFAEGIGRPVFYLCRHDKLDHPDPKERPHFDIAHHAIVKWDPADPARAVEELVAMIRATLPAEAHMEDPPAG